MGIFLSNVITEKLNNLHKHPIVHKNVDRKKKKSTARLLKEVVMDFASITWDTK
ncbi:MAG: hypothetical protein E6274_10850 [Clostridium sp.]|uniref:hypothetical protein n=1 Tax=Clostridium sp. TaxID=1506 RepID=UPI0029131C1E|nr:hypothetical protein [Clostridium sp.]MDU7252813.1 hypothetical protein [Clostridium sp.]